MERRKGRKELLNWSRSKYIAGGESSSELVLTVSDKYASTTKILASERRAREKADNTYNSR